MKYTITPLNVLVLVFITIAIYDYVSITHDDGLAATNLVIGIGALSVVMLIDLAIQKFIKAYKWILIMEIVIAFIFVFWIANGIIF